MRRNKKIGGILMNRWDNTPFKIQKSKNETRKWKEKKTTHNITLSFTMACYDSVLLSLDGAIRVASMGHRITLPHTAYQRANA